MGLNDRKMLLFEFTFIGITEITSVWEYIIDLTVVSNYYIMDFLVSWVSICFIRIHILRILCESYEESYTKCVNAYFYNTYPPLLWRKFSRINVVVTNVYEKLNPPIENWDLMKLLKGNIFKKGQNWHKCLFK